MTVIIFSFAIFLFISIFYSTLYYGIGPVFTSKKVLKKVSSLFKTDEKNVKILELGSGWGNVMMKLSKLLPSSKITCYEMSILPFLFSFLWKKIFLYENVSIYWKNFFSYRLDADIIFCYLCPKAMKKLEEKLKSSSVKTVISHTFAFPNIKADKIIEADDIYRTKIYYYIFK